MNNKCINLRHRKHQNKYYGFCVKYKKEVPLFCKCKNIEYKKQKTIKLRTYSQSKKEKERFSIIYTDLTKCCLCGSIKGINKHEVYFGRKNRQTSIKYGCIIPLCDIHHKQIHNDIELDLYYKRLMQKACMNYYNIDVNGFIKIFGRSYL